MMILAMILVVLCTGCASLENPTARRLEYAYQAVHAIDTLQTRAMVGSPCYYEASPTRHLIGKYPSEGSVAAWAVGYGMAHAWFSKKLEPYPFWQRLWQMSTLTIAAGSIVQNHGIGLRVDGENRPC